MYASNQFPVKPVRIKPSTLGTLFYVTPDGEKPVPSAVGLPYHKLAAIKKALNGQGIHNLIQHRHD